MSRLHKLFIISSLLLFALIYVGTIEKNRNIVGNKIIWSKKNLTWKNFTKVEEKENDYVATISSEIYCPENISWLQPHVFAYMDPDESEKLADSMLSDEVLIHEQYHFNITEFHARLLRKDIVKIGKENLTKIALDSLFNKYFSQNELMQVEYDSITDHSVNVEKQRFWELTIDDYLRQTAYYQNDDILGYNNYDMHETKFFRKVYRTFDNVIVGSFPINEQETFFGECYMIEKEGSETIVSFIKNGKIKTGGIFKTAITTIEIKDEVQKISYLNSDETLNKNLDYSFFNRITVGNEQTDHYFNYKNERISVNNVYQTKSHVNANGSVLTIYFDKDTNRINNKFGVSQKRRTLDSLGRTIKLEFFNKNNKPINDIDFVSKVVKEYDSNSLLIAYKEYDDTGGYGQHLYSYNTKYEYDERGNLVKTVNLNKDSEIAPNKSGISIYTYSYDAKDNLVSTKRFNRFNQPVQGSDDYHMDLEIYDEKGRVSFNGKYYSGNIMMFNEDKWGATEYVYSSDSLIVEKNIDVYGDNFNDDTGVAIIEKHLDKKKRLIKMVYLDLNNNYAKTEDGIVKFQYKYDERGNKIEESTYDSLANLIPFSEDVAIVRWEYNLDNKVKTTYYNTSNELANANQNITYNLYKYDTKGKVIERSNLNKKGKPQLLDGYFKKKFVLNRFGGDSIIMSYDENSKPIKGVFKTVYTYNKFNNNISESFYNSNNDITLNNSGVASIKYFYDNRQLNYGYGYFNKEGIKTNNNLGVSYNIRTLNDLGYILTDYYYSKNGNPVKGTEGYYKKEYNWNVKGEITEISIYGENKKLMEDITGVATYKYSRYDSGLISVIKRYDKSGVLTNDTCGKAETYYKEYLNGLYFLDKELDFKGKKINN